MEGFRRLSLHSWNSACTLDRETHPRPTMSRNYLCKNDELRRGDSLFSNNGEWKAAFQWDCNLVMYTKSDRPIWATNSVKNCTMCHLRLTNDDKLMRYRDTEQVWSSASDSP